MPPKQAYEELTNTLREITILNSCSSLLNWDQRTYMPRGGAKNRADQLGLIAGMVHEKFTSPKIGELLKQIEGTDLVATYDSVEAANIREIRRRYDRQTKLPKSLVEEFVKTTSMSETAWETARAKNDFKSFAPWLEKVIGLTRQIADCYGFKGEPYNALIDDYEPGMTVEEISTVFEKLRVDLVELNGKIRNGKKRPKAEIITRNYPVELQRVFGESVAAAVGLDFNEARLDVTVHPFCSGMGPGDTRITTRYEPRRLNDALFGVLHETGHALYDIGLDAAYYGLPCGEAASYGIHESQSRMWENQVGRSKEFWVYFLPQAKRIFREALDGVTLEEFYGAVNDSQPSYIRVEADEATYNLHILLRYELERSMIKGDLKAADLAGEWNSRFKKYFGIEVDKDANGCLQDVHWSAGLIAYFPSYSLGNLYSAQFFAKAKADIPGLMTQFERGEFSGLLQWLRANIHKHGQRYRPADLCKKVTGQPLSHKPLIDYMTAKYSEIYGF
jgi:carboxypeptidase Taq